MASTSMNQETLEQLKKDLLTEGGLIQDTTDARSHLDMTGMTAPDTTITAFNIAKILLSLVATSSAKRTANEKILEKVVNILKAATLLLDNLTTTAQDAEQRLVDKITAKIGHENSLNNMANLELKNQMETNVNFLKHAASSQTEVTEKANALLAKMVKLHEQTKKTIKDTLNMPKESPKMNTPYKDALVNGQSTTTPQTPSQCKIMNCINIKA